MTDLEILRKAADLMRRRAASATTGPWYVDCVDGIYAWGDDPGNRLPVILDRGRGGSYEDLVHTAAIATPAVALAVAEWLDSHARDLASSSGRHSACDSPGDLQHALRVARAYLAPEGVEQ